MLAKHFRSEPVADGPSWLIFIGHLKDSLWSVDLFRVESILLRSHWVILVMDVFTRRIIGFGVAPAHVDDMFNQATAGQPKSKHLGTDHDSLFRFHRWLANLRLLQIEEIKSVAHAPVSNPFVERLIGTIRREYLERVFFWNAVDLARKLGEFRDYYNAHRVHRSLDGTTPAQRAGRIFTRSRLTGASRMAAALPRPVSDPIAACLGIHHPQASCPPSPRATPPCQSHASLAAVGHFPSLCAPHSGGKIGGGLRGLGKRSKTVPKAGRDSAGTR